jgi:hypothetical protein
MSDNVRAQYGRVKGASWFPLLHKKDIMVLGQGGIGSWVSLLLGRVGCRLHVYDMDVYEEHNMTGQVVGKSSVGKAKTEAIKDTLAEFSPDCEVFINGKYVDETETNDVVICGFDNMMARKIAFRNWRDYLSMLPEEKRKQCFFQDGRLLAEQLQIFNIPGDKTDWMDLYEANWLFDDAEVEEADCTFKQTSHCAAMIAGHMVGFLTNWASNALATPEDILDGHVTRMVPFLYEYVIPINYTT